MLAMADLFELVDLMIGADGHGRLAGSSPHFYVFRTPERAVCRCHVRLEDGVVSTLEDTVLAPHKRPRDAALQFGRALNLLASVAPLRSVRAGPLYRIRQAPGGGDAATRITRANADLLRGGLDEWLPDVGTQDPMYAVVVEGRAVSICASVRASDDAHQAGVETLREYRGRGFAAGAVAAWAGSVLQLGASAFYATTFDNVPSQGVARRLGMTLVGAELFVDCDFAEGE
jgi:hypothetical protein